MITYHDVVAHVLDYYGAMDSTGEGSRFAKSAVLSSYRELSSSRRWSYFLQQGQLHCNAAYSTGTVEFDFTGGSSERLVTLTDGTWPTWAAFGRLRIGNQDYEIAERLSATTLKLSTNSNPGEDVADETTYTIYRDTYPMPSDFVAAGEILNKGNALPLKFEHMEEWLTLQRVVQGPATPRVYTITSDPNYFGAMALRLFPAPDDDYTLDFAYQRRPRTLHLYDYSTGTVTVTASSTTVTGSGTAWTSDMVGSVIRFANDSRNVPTGVTGLYPYHTERVITAYTSATSVTIDQVTGADYTGYKYQISDPIDLEEGSMMTYLLRLAEQQARLHRRVKTGGEEMAALDQARTIAWENDSRSFERRGAGSGGRYRPRLRDMPSGADVS